MRRISKPTFDARQVFEKCISGIDDVQFKARLISEIGAAVSASAEFEALANARRLDAYPLRDKLGSTITCEEMKSLYKGQFSAKSGAARDIYNLLRNSSPNKKCPLCGVGVVSTLDHHLPQSKYADLTVLPINLIPACSDCNKKKLSTHPRSEAEQTLHPYYDDFTGEVWIRAIIDRGPPPVLVYEVVCPPSWNSTIQARAKRHFGIFGLASLYGANAADELITLRDHLSSLELSDVQPYLESEAGRHSVIKNSWQSAMYRSLAGDQWFCSEGFLQIPRHD